MSDSTKELSGRELDIAIAERVMRWPRRDRDDDRDYEDTYFSAYNDGGQIVVFRGGSQRSAERWSPAQNIEAAMQVVEAAIPLLPDNEVIKNLGFAQVRMYRYANGTWCVAFTKRSGKSVTASSLPEAICRAALAAMEQKN